MNYYDDPHDMQVMIAVMRRGAGRRRELADAPRDRPAARPAGPRRQARPRRGRRRRATTLLEDLARHYSLTVYHPTSTCRMGSVVDERLRVARRRQPTRRRRQRHAQRGERQHQRGLHHDRREGRRDDRRRPRREAGRVRPPGSLTSRATFGRGILGDVAESPTGTVTFLFTDVEGSTAAWEQHPDAMRAALVAHDELLRSTISTHGGYVFSTGGDGFAVAFARAEHAIRVAVESQAALARASWPDGLALRVRMGIHSGETDERGGDYFGPAVNRARTRDGRRERGTDLGERGDARDRRRATMRRLSDGSTSASTSFATSSSPSGSTVSSPREFASDPRPPRSGTRTSRQPPCRRRSALRPVTTTSNRS